MFVPDSDEELDEKETKSKPISKKNNLQTDNTTKAKESGNKRAKKGQKQPEDKKVAEDKNQAGSKAENPFKV